MLTRSWATSVASRRLAAHVGGVESEPAAGASARASGRTERGCNMAANAVAEGVAAWSKISRRRLDMRVTCPDRPVTHRRSMRNPRSGLAASLGSRACCSTGSSSRWLGRITSRACSLPPAPPTRPHGRVYWLPVLPVKPRRNCRLHAAAAPPQPQASRLQGRLLCSRRRPQLPQPCRRRPYLPLCPRRDRLACSAASASSAACTCTRQPKQTTHVRTPGRLKHDHAPQPTPRLPRPPLPRRPRTTFP